MTATLARNTPGRRKTAGAQPVAAQEICVPDGDQPANSQQARCDATVKVSCRTGRRR